MGDIKCRLSILLGCRRISQRQLARDSGLSVFTVNKLYNERWSGVDKQTIVKLCETLKVDVGELFVYIEIKDKRKKIKPRPRRK